jgi:hypothetical protein
VQEKAGAENIKKSTNVIVSKNIVKMNSKGALGMQH